MEGIGTPAVVGIRGEFLVLACDCCCWCCCSTSIALREISTVEIVRDGSRGYGIHLNPGLMITSDRGGGHTDVIAFTTQEVDQFGSQLAAAVNARRPVPQATSSFQASTTTS